MHRQLRDPDDLLPLTPVVFHTLLALVDGDEVLAGLGIYRLGQYFGGRSVPMAGIAAVGVPPEHRGRGVAKQLMTLTLQGLRDEGPVLNIRHGY